MKKSRQQKKGFALLYAILLTSAVLIVGVSLINIITRQLILTSFNRNSQIAYYNSRSMTECLDFYVTKNSYFLQIDNETGAPTGVKDSEEIQCGFLSDNITLNSSLVGGDIYIFEGKTNFADSGSSYFKVYYNLDNLYINSNYDGCGDEVISDSFQESCAKVIRTSGSNFALDNSNPRKVERISLIAR
ncbi:MAG: hypothetical protein BWY53_00753 [Parcubacteria group bacterium ADurb.Bin326]|jgi:hypothetical protein|nr:MAG: hypothetical protein BWY53_00753 [Parcubacteria group bacterium ADurb.Bin326]HPI24537.1 hypothetical protein [Candidatus Paceibacterota bacterium]HPN89509.1 hypothetical protein [Candidatus Paceibacterota bacterium]